MLLAATETFLSRPIAPTRRISLGTPTLPVEPPPGFGGLLLAGIVGRFVPQLDDDTLDDLGVLLVRVERGQRIPQPALRHRLQDDNIGLQRCVHRLLDTGEGVELHLETHKGTPLQHVLCAVYEAARLPHQRGPIMDLIRQATTWSGGSDDDLLAHLSDGTASGGFAAAADPIGWAIELLAIDIDRAAAPTRQQVQQAFRTQLRSAHPDHGGEITAAAERIRQLDEARRILLR